MTMRFARCPWHPRHKWCGGKPILCHFESTKTLIHPSTKYEKSAIPVTISLYINSIYYSIYYYTSEPTQYDIILEHTIGTALVTRAILVKLKGGLSRKRPPVDAALFYSVSSRLSSAATFVLRCSATIRRRPVMAASRFSLSPLVRYLSENDSQSPLTCNTTSPRRF